jgi:hypothetical protein
MIRYVYPIVAENPDKYKENIKSIFSKISDEDAKQIFSKRGPFGGSGSEGLQDKLFRHLLSMYNF